MSTADIVKAATKYLHYERAWRIGEVPDDAESMVRWRQALSDALSDYYREDDA